MRINRALSGPININNDHSDSMEFDAGWIQIYAENNQEAYDNFIMAMPIGETPERTLAGDGMHGWIYYQPCCGEYRSFGDRRCA